MTNPKEHSRLWKLLAVVGILVVVTVGILWWQRAHVCVHFLDSDSSRISSYALWGLRDTNIEDRKQYMPKYLELLEHPKDHVRWHTLQVIFSIYPEADQERIRFSKKQPELWKKIEKALHSLF